jgi:hypothetical protein
MREEVRVARRVGRSMIGASLVCPILIGFQWVAQPGSIGGMSFVEPWYVGALPWVAWAVYLIGLAWMIRIYRTSHLEPETSSWRYRDD